MKFSGQQQYPCSSRTTQAPFLPQLSSPASSARNKTQVPVSSLSAAPLCHGTEHAELQTSILSMAGGSSCPASCCSAMGLFPLLCLHFFLWLFLCFLAQNANQNAKVLSPAPEVTEEEYKSAHVSWEGGTSLSHCITQQSRGLRFPSSNSHCSQP